MLPSTDNIEPTLSCTKVSKHDEVSSMPPSTNNIEPTLFCTLESKPHVFNDFQVELISTVYKDTDEEILIIVHKEILVMTSNIIIVDTLEPPDFPTQINDSSQTVLFLYHNAQILHFELSRMQLSTFFPPSVNFEFKHTTSIYVEMSPQFIALQKRSSKSIKECQESLVNNIIMIN
jgi:hypothetical protein